MLKHNSKISDFILYSNLTKKKPAKSKQSNTIIESLLHSTQKTISRSKLKSHKTLSPNTTYEDKAPIAKSQYISKNDSTLNQKITKVKAPSLNFNLIKTKQNKSQGKFKINQNYALHRQNSNSKNKSQINSKKNSTIIVSRSNSNSNLDQTTTIASSSSKRKSQQITLNPIIKNIKLKNILINSNKKNFFDYQKQILHTQVEEIHHNNTLFGIYSDHILKTKSNKNENTLLHKPTKVKLKLIKNINNINDKNEVIKRKIITDELISEDSVFNYSKTNSFSLNNNSKEKNKSLVSRNNDSLQQTLSFTYSDDEGSVEKYKQIKQKKQVKNKNNVQKGQRNKNISNIDLMKNVDFLTFCEQMNEKLFNGK